MPRISRRSSPSARAGRSCSSAIPAAARSSRTPAHRAPDVRALVYVNAFIPDEGETVVQILDGSGSALAVADPTTVLDIAGYPGTPEGAAEAFLKAEVVHGSFAQDLDEATRWTIVASQRPASLVANVSPSGTPAWRSVPSWAVIGTDDRVIPVAVLRSMAGRAGATVTELPASHVSMVSHPEVAVEAILAAIAATA